MKLYHGTTEAVARAAFKNGLQPRAHTGADSNWKDNPSSPDLVYLTTAYAPYFAMAACENGESWGIVEVDTTDLETARFQPDEDFIEQASRGNELIPVSGIVERTAWVRYRLDNFAHHWRDSIEGLGNCAYAGEVPGIAVTRVAIFDPSSNQMVTTVAKDPTITLLNYAIMGGKYRALSRWFMGEDITPNDIGESITGALGLSSDQESAARRNLPPAMFRIAQQRGEHVLKELERRDGLEVLEALRGARTACCGAFIVIGADGVEVCTGCGIRDSEGAESLDPWRDEPA